jgi:hypothetical protein
MNLLSGAGKAKLQAFIDELRLLLPKPASAKGATAAAEEKAITAAEMQPISASQRILSDAIKLLSALLEHNSTKDTDQLKALMRLVDGGLNSHSPAIFDELSAQYGEATRNFLNGLNPATDLAWGARLALKTAGKSADTYLKQASVQLNLNRQLFTLLSRSSLVSPSVGPVIELAEPVALLQKLIKALAILKQLQPTGFSREATFAALNTAQQELVRKFATCLPTALDQPSDLDWDAISEHLNKQASHFLKHKIKIDLNDDPTELITELARQYHTECQLRTERLIALNLPHFTLEGIEEPILTKRPFVPAEGVPAFATLLCRPGVLKFQLELLTAAEAELESELKAAGLTTIAVATCRRLCIAATGKSAACDEHDQAHKAAVIARIEGFLTTPSNAKHHAGIHGYRSGSKGALVKNLQTHIETLYRGSRAAETNDLLINAIKIALNAHYDHIRLVADNGISFGRLGGIIAEFCADLIDLFSRQAITHDTAFASWLEENLPAAHVITSARTAAPQALSTQAGAGSSSAARSPLRVSLSPSARLRLVSPASSPHTDAELEKHGVHLESKLERSDKITTAVASCAV